MRTLIAFITTVLIGLACLSPGEVVQAAPLGFLSSNTTGSVSCNTAGDCGTILLTPASDGYQYWYQASCLTRSGFTSVSNCDWGNFNPSYSNCDWGNATWGSPCTIDVLESGLAAGTYPLGLYVDYVYCPNDEFNSAAGSCATYYEVTQTVMTASSASTTPTPSGSGTQSTPASSAPQPSVPAPDALSLFALALLGVIGLRRDRTDNRYATRVRQTAAGFPEHA